MDKVREDAVRSVMGKLNLTANDVNRYIADAVLEHDPLKAENAKLRAELDAALYEKAGWEGWARALFTHYPKRTKALSGIRAGFEKWLARAENGETE